MARRAPQTGEIGHLYVPGVDCIAAMVVQTGVTVTAINVSRHRDYVNMEWSAIWQKDGSRSDGLRLRLFEPRQEQQTINSLLVQADKLAVYDPEPELYSDEPPASWHRLDECYHK